MTFDHDEQIRFLASAVQQVVLVMAHQIQYGDKWDDGYRIDRLSVAFRKACDVLEAQGLDAYMDRTPTWDDRELFRQPED